ncbi:HNH endonuclease [Bradyrhizobium valentinum]|uniref:HNH endonuclease n=1 Tax=Bradyrhizobium valentinum TaxID=1518501 RepID=UPI0012E37B0A|nr:HNH endonuclease [Bradyrhizobium valentinum]
MKRSRQQTERAVSVEVLRRLFRCDAKRGLLFWRRRAVDHYRIVAWNKRFAGKQAGNDNGLGHLQIAFAIDGVKYYSTVHRVIWALSHSHWPTDDLDHRHGERSHNAIVELRDCTPSDNQRNRRLHKNNTSGFKGISWVPKLQKYLVQIQVNKAAVKLGYFVDKIEEAKTYDVAAIKHFGEFAKTNRQLGLLP